jgi:hypothetical protein
MITLDGQAMHLRPVAIRDSWPTELDLMASRAGLRLTERHAEGPVPVHVSQRRPRLRLP